MTNKQLTELKQRIGEVSDLSGALSLMGWDQRTIMPPDGAGVRSYRMATLGKIAHELATSEEMGRLLEDLEPLEADLPFDSHDASLIRVARRDYLKARVMPSDLLVESTHAENEGYEAWIEARASANYERLRPSLEKIVDLRRRQIEIYKDAFPGEYEEDYDVLLDDFEPKLKAREVSRVFADVRDATIPLVKRVTDRADHVNNDLVHGDFNPGTQRELALTIARQLGFDDASWRLDPTEHPFASSIATSDIRITTRYNPTFLNTAMFGTMHEFGHGLYERGVSPDLERTNLRRGASMAFHESQSRMWENLIGRGRPFWDWGMPKVKDAFPEAFGDASPDDMYRAVNKLGPSLIRVEADELTYNLHIIIRFEIEQDIFAGRIDLADLPRVWNEKISTYLNIEVPNDAEGVLQDVHWGSGLFGYFPTYALGNVVSLQLWERIRADLPALDEQVANGEFGELREWLVTNVHRHGRKFTPNELLQRVVGTPHFDPRPLVSYLTAKVEDLYGA